MKKVLLLSLALVLVFSAFGLVGCGSEEPEPETEVEAEAEATEPLPAGVQAIKDAGSLRVGVKADVPNFGLQDAATGEFSGLEIDLAYALAERIGLTEDDVKFEAVTAKTRGPLLDNGQIDVVIATFTIKPERLEQWNFTDPYYQDEVGLLVKKDSGIKGLADLDGKIVGLAQVLGGQVDPVGLRDRGLGHPARWLLAAGLRYREQARLRRASRLHERDACGDGGERRDGRAP